MLFEGYLVFYVIFDKKIFSIFCYKREQRISGFLSPLLIIKKYFFLLRPVSNADALCL